MTGECNSNLHVVHLFGCHHFRVSRVRGRIFHKVKIMFQALVVCSRRAINLGVLLFYPGGTVIVWWNVFVVQLLQIQIQQTRSYGSIFSPWRKLWKNKIQAHNSHPVVEIARVSLRGFHFSMPNTQRLPQRNELRVKLVRRRQAAWAVPRAGSTCSETVGSMGRAGVVQLLQIQTQQTIPLP